MTGEVPAIEGFTVQRDPLTDGWVAISPSGRYTLRGRNEGELLAARWQAYGQLVEQFRAANAELFPRRPDDRGTGLERSRYPGRGSVAAIGSREVWAPVRFQAVRKDRM